MCLVVKLCSVHELKTSCTQQVLEGLKYLHASGARCVFFAVSCVASKCESVTQARRVAPRHQGREHSDDQGRDRETGRLWRRGARGQVGPRFGARARRRRRRLAVLFSFLNNNKSVQQMCLFFSSSAGREKRNPTSRRALSLSLSSRKGSDTDLLRCSYWMAPEIIEMSAAPSTACDIWSLGVTVIELTAGQPPHFQPASRAGTNGARKRRRGVWRSVPRLGGFGLDLAISLALAFCATLFGGRLDGDLRRGSRTL